MAQGIYPQKKKKPAFFPYGKNAGTARAVLPLCFAPASRRKPRQVRTGAAEHLGRPTTPRRYNGRAPGRAYCKFQPTAHEMNSADSACCLAPTGRSLGSTPPLTTFRSNAFNASILSKLSLFVNTFAQFNIFNTLFKGRPRIGARNLQLPILGRFIRLYYSSEVPSGFFLPPRVTLTIPIIAEIQATAS